MRQTSCHPPRARFFPHDRAGVWPAFAMDNLTWGRKTQITYEPGKTFFAWVEFDGHPEAQTQGVGIRITLLSGNRDSCESYRYGRRDRGRYADVIRRRHPKRASTVPRK